MLVISLPNRAEPQGRQVASQLVIIWLSPEHFDGEGNGRDDGVKTPVASLENSISRTPSHWKNMCEEFLHLGAIPNRVDGIYAQL